MSDQFQFLSEAKSDIRSIWQFLSAEKSQNTADEIVDRILLECARLAEMPGMGHYREDLLDKSYRFWNASSYLIVYQWQVQPIQVIAVVHGARNLGAFLANRV